MQTCLDQYRANKANGGNGGLKWIEREAAITVNAINALRGRPEKNENFTNGQFGPDQQVGAKGVSGGFRGVK